MRVLMTYITSYFQVQRRRNDSTVVYSEMMTTSCKHHNCLLPGIQLTATPTDGRITITGAFSDPFYPSRYSEIRPRTCVGWSTCGARRALLTIRKRFFVPEIKRVGMLADVLY
jgi:hypothetical protein